MKGRLEDRVAIVVGAGSCGPGWGNGKATAVTFAREGAKVVAMDVNVVAAEETVGLIRDSGGEAIPYQADVTRPDQIKALVDECMVRYGRVDIMHYNVGIPSVGGCVETTIENWQHNFDVNVTGCFQMCQQVLPIMERQRSGVVLTVGSIAGVRLSRIPMIAYCASKAALIHFTRAVALEYAKKGIRAACIVPGRMDTPTIYQNSIVTAYSSNSDNEEMRRIRNEQCPTGSMGEGWDIANAALFVASDEGKYITGTEIVVDGGVIARYE